MSLYALRGLGVALFLAAPKTPAVMLGFALWMGLTYMATLPPTTALVGRIAGGQRLATLFGVVMAVHQLGAFLGAWAGGLAVAATGSHTVVWLVDIALAAVAVMLHLPLLQRGGEARSLATASA
ncbi:MAG: MFS transporter [Thauera phenolivorans]|uniref:MFS transporter n=1 Tax=Thauera phenolivorans TaxID=1792543 RepID=A0A7X7LVX6_9RHOO|nr:MFS transporter [Thauera phenolivorans]